MLKCQECGGDINSKGAFKISFNCKCGAPEVIDSLSVNKEGGAMVDHVYPIGFAKGKLELDYATCPYMTYIPPTVWCAKCRCNFVDNWKSHLIQGTREEIREQTEQFTDAYARAMRRLARELINQHDTIQEVRFLNDDPYFEIEFLFKDGHKLLTGRRTGQIDINMVSYGQGAGFTGITCLHHFLQQAGFKLSRHDIHNIKSGSILFREGDKIMFRETDSVKE